MCFVSQADWMYRDLISVSDTQTGYIQKRLEQPAISSLSSPALSRCSPLSSLFPSSVPLPLRSPSRKLKKASKRGESERKIEVIILMCGTTSVQKEWRREKRVEGERREE